MSPRPGSYVLMIVSRVSRSLGERAARSRRQPDRHRQRDAKSAMVK